MNKKTFRIIYIDFTNETGVGLSRDPGAKVCAEIHRLEKFHLAIIQAIPPDLLSADGVVLPDWIQPLSVLGIYPSAIFLDQIEIGAGK